MEAKKPPLFTKRSLVIFTKILAFYTAFYTITAFIPIFKNPVSENPLMEDNHYAPLLFMAAVHVLMLLITLFCIVKNKYSWVVTLALFIIVLLSRIYFSEIQLWVWSWT